MEFALVVASCRRCFIAEAPAPLPPLTNSSIDWSLFLHLVRRHRVPGLTWQGLSELETIVPQRVMDELEAGAAGVAEQNLRLAVESAALLSEFRQLGLPLIILKGLPLGALVYRQPLLKMGLDIDLLIAPEDLFAVAGLLSRRGYAPLIPQRAADPSELLRWHQQHKESVWRRADGGFQLDLHTRTADNEDLIPQITVHSPAQEVSVVGSIELRTFALEQQFAYLAVHGASSAWFRLKWLADFSALLAQSDPGTLDKLYAKSQELQAGRAAAWGLLLADKVFGVPISDLLRRKLRQDRTNLLLLNVGYRQLLADREPTERRFGTVPIHLSQLALLSGAGRKTRELKRQVRSILYR